GVATSNPVGGFREEEWDAFKVLADNGFLVASRDADRRNLNAYLNEVKGDTSELNVTVLTTLQCNFACDYCFQGDHGDYNKHADKMSPDTSEQVARWIDARMDELHPKRLTVTFFGGEPLVNLPALYDLAERAWKSTQARGIELTIGIISNGLLLTEELVDRLVPFGLNYVKITLDGDRDTHN